MPEPLQRGKCVIKFGNAHRGRSYDAVMQDAKYMMWLLKRADAGNTVTPEQNHFLEFARATIQDSEGKTGSTTTTTKSNKNDVSVAAEDDDDDEWEMDLSESIVNARLSKVEEQVENIVKKMADLGLK